MTTRQVPLIIRQDSWGCRLLRLSYGRDQEFPSEICQLRLAIVGAIGLWLFLAGVLVAAIAMFAVMIRDVTLAGTLWFLGYTAVSFPVIYFTLPHLPRLIDRISQAGVRCRLAIKQWLHNKFCRPVRYI